ncbi:MAG: hypothetical protein VYD09_01130 [Chloroflexota bacterium]|nr:hypothetical protein [Chloroflexota bacterium]
MIACETSSASTSSTAGYSQGSGQYSSTVTPVPTVQQPRTTTSVATVRQSSTPTTVPTVRPVSTGISGYDARKHIGETKTVCGIVVDTHYARTSNGRPTFLNFDAPYPNHPFVALIWGEMRNNFGGSPESFFLGRMLCVRGLIESYKGKPQIILRSVSQIQ